MRRVFTTKLNRTSVCGTRRRCRSYLFCCSFSPSKQTTSFTRAEITQACEKLSSDQICVLGRRIPLVDIIRWCPKRTGRGATIVPLLGRIRVGADLQKERRYHPPRHQSALAPIRLGQSAVTPTSPIRLGTFGNLCEIL